MNKQKPKLVVQTGHSGAVKSAIFSPDGKIVASNGTGGIIIWESATGREIRRISGVFSAIDFAPDSKNLVAAETTEGIIEEARKKPFLIEIFSVNDGKLVKNFPTHKNVINSVKFSRDGNSILTASDDHTAKLWNVTNGRLKRTFIGHKSEVSCAVFSTDNNLIATSSSMEESSAIIWNADTGKQIRKIIHIDAGKDDFRGIGFVQFSPDNKFILTSPQHSLYSDNTFTIRVWDWRTGKKIYSFAGTGPAIFSPDGKNVFADIDTSKDERVIELFNLQKGIAIAHFNDINWWGQIESLSFSPDGKYALIAVGLIDSGGAGTGMDGDQTLRMYETKSGKEIFNLGASLQPVKQLSISKDGNIVLAGDYVWNLEQGELVNLENFKPENLEREFNYQLPRRILSSDGKLVAESLNPYNEENPNANNFAGVQIWNTDTGQGKRLLPAEDWKSAEFTQDNQFILAESPSDVCLWRIVDAKEIWCQDHIEEAMGMRATYAMSRIVDGSRFSIISGDGKTVYIRKDENTLIAVNATTGEITWQKSIVMSDDLGIFLSNKYIIVPSNNYEKGGENSFLVFLDIKTRKEILRVEADSNTYSTNDQNVLTAYQESKKQRVFINKNTGKIIATLPKELNEYDDTSKFNSYFSRLGLSSDTEKFLAIYGSELRLYGLKSGKVLETFRGHNSDVSRAMFLNNDNQLISSSLDGTTRIWDVKTGSELCSLISFDNGNWFVTAPDGRFDTNSIESSVAGIHWIVNDAPLSPLPVEIFMRQYYEPNLLLRLLKCTKEENCNKEFKPLPSITDINRVQPKVTIEEIKHNADLPDLADITIEVENVTEDVSLSVTDKTKKKQLSSGAFDLRLFRAGQLVGDSTQKDKLEKFIADAPRLVAETKASGKLVNTPEDAAWREANDVFKIQSENVKIISPTKIEYTFRNIKIPKDGRKEVEFTAYAFNADKVKSTTTAPVKFTVPENIVNTPKKGRAFIVSIGVNASENPAYNLHYAANDARKMQEILGERLKAATDNYSEVIEIPLVSDYDQHGNLVETGARKEIIRGVFSLLSGNENEVPASILEQIPNRQQIKPVEPEDTLIINYSGHGYADRSGIFYLLPYDIGEQSEQLTTESLSRLISSDELSLWMRDITAAEMIMIIDACHSSAAVQGDGFKPGPMGSRGLGQLAYDKDMKILSATQANNVALELGSLQQGLLSYALIQDGIIRFLADEDKNRQLFSDEWLAYAEKRVPELYTEIKDGKRDVIIDDKPIKADGSRTGIVQLSGSKKSNLNLQQPALFDFKRRKFDKVLLTLP